MKVKELLEAIAISQAKPYLKAWDPSTYKNIFSKFPDHNKNYTRIYLPLGKEEKKVEQPKEIDSKINDLGYKVDDYISGIASKISDPKRKIKIGKLLSQDPDLLKKFTNDPQRSLSKNSDLEICISRHPYDVAGMSTGRGWSSCMNLTDGINSHYVMADVKAGTLVAYLINKNDRNLQHPVARIAIKPFLNINDSDYILVPSNNVYGEENSLFEKKVHEWCDKVSSRKMAGLYCVDGSLYPERYDDKFKIHGDINDLDEQEILEILEHKPDIIKHIKNPTEEMQMLAVKADGRLIKDIKNPSEELQLAAINETPEAFEFIKNPSEEMQMLAVQENGSAVRFIKNPSEKVQMLAIQKNGYNIRFIDNPTEEMQMLAVKADGRLIKDINNPSEELKLFLVNQNPENIELLHNPSLKLQLAAIRQNPDSYRFIDNPSEAATQLYRSLSKKPS